MKAELKTLYNEIVDWDKNNFSIKPVAFIGEIKNKIEHILGLPVEAQVKPACEHCRSYEMTKEAHLQNFCSQFCIRMDKLYGWDITKDSCNKFVSKSV